MAEPLFYFKAIMDIETENIKNRKYIQPLRIYDDEGWSEEELDAMANAVEDWEDIADEYENGEVHLIDAETGEVIDDLRDSDLDEEVINEILSRAERIRAKVRFRKSAVKRQRSMKIALTRHSSSERINARARALAIKTMKMKLAKKPLNTLGPAEKERIERIIAKRKNVVDRLALKMTVRVRKIEKDRLSHNSTK